MVNKKLIRKKSKNKIKSKVYERINELFESVKKEYPDSLYKKKISLMETYSSKYKVSIPSEIKSKYCKNCYNLLIPGKTAKIRFKPKQKIKIITCLNCSKIKRLGYKEKSKE
ncbi:MAG: ribonuclease P protein component 4 [Nanobdellota archaeon]